MPTYCYQTRTGEVHEEVYPIGKAPRSIIVNGEEATRCFAAERKSFPSTSGWPLECVASGVNARDRHKLEAEFNRLGVPTKVSADGNPIYTDASHRKKALKARGFFDKSAYA